MFLCRPACSACTRPIPLSFRQKLRICACDRCSAGRKCDVGRERVGCARAIKRGFLEMPVFLLSALEFAERTNVQENGLVSRSIKERE